MLGELFWASLLIILGFSTLFGALFGINIPIFRIFLGIFLLYLGIQLIGNWPSCKKKSRQSVYFGKQSITVTPETISTIKNRQYSVLFGNTNIDFSKIDTIDPDIKPVEIKINTGFGKTTVILNKKLSTLVISSASFGAATFPDNTEINFGSYTYRTQNDKNPDLILKTNTAFGKLEIETE